MLLLFVILAYSLAPVSPQNQHYFCDKRYKIISSFKQEDCVTDQYYLHDRNFGCFPSCEETQKKNFCGNEEGEKLCRPGFNCVLKGGDTVCELEENSCSLYWNDYGADNKAYWDAHFTPICLKDRTWAPKQCKEDGVGRCFCYDKLGKRLHGHSWMSDAQNMTCACSRKRAELESDSKNWFVSLHCDKQGNYEELQCSHEHCWCAEPQTGDVTSVVVPDSWMKKLPCYNETIVGEQYLRVCESELYARAKIAREFNIHGTSDISFTPLYCAADGGYGSFTELDGQLYCIWKDPETKLGAGAETEADRKRMNCNCVRDAQLYKEEGKNPQKLKCDGVGNYDGIQKVEGGHVCVDSDGFPKHEGVRPDTEPIDDARKTCNEMK